MAGADLIAFVEAMDRCWLERRFDDLSQYLAADVMVTAPNATRVEGAAAVIESYRQFMARAEVAAFEAFAWDVTERSDTALVQYGWRMRWSSAGETHAAEGREVLALSRRANEWRIVSRTQVQL